jgi:hypothetical protein
LYFASHEAPRNRMFIWTGDTTKNSADVLLVVANIRRPSIALAPVAGDA